MRNRTTLPTSIVVATLVAGCGSSSLHVRGQGPLSAYEEVALPGADPEAVERALATYAGDWRLNASASSGSDHLLLGPIRVMESEAEGVSADDLNPIRMEVEEADKVAVIRMATIDLLRYRPVKLNLAIEDGLLIYSPTPGLRLPLPFDGTPVSYWMGGVDAMQSVVTRLGWAGSRPAIVHKVVPDGHIHEVFEIVDSQLRITRTGRTSREEFQEVVLVYDRE